MNLWHDIDPGTADEMVTVIEIPRGSQNKYEIDKETGLIKLDRVLHTAQVYPCEYGFIPQTLWEDGDALDTLVLSTEPFVPGVLVDIRPIGLMDMVDNGEPDAKVIGVPVGDPRWKNVNDIHDINPHTIKELEHFFCTYKQLQNKVCEVVAFKGAADAKAAFEKGKQLYAEKFGKK